MRPIGDEVRRELSRFGPAAGMAELVEAWPASVGEAIAQNAWPARIGRDGTLHVYTADAIWAFELGQREAEIRDRLGSLVPAQLRFLPGPLPEPGPTEESTTPKPPKPRPSPDVLAEAERLAARIDDEDLRKVVEKAVAASLVRARSGRGF
jgi:Dna[CI] antecedent DciA-like protein